jgi:hypothetical protein
MDPECGCSTPLQSQVDTVAPLVAYEPRALPPANLDEAELREQPQRSGVPRVDIRFDRLQAVHLESPFEYGSQGFLSKSAAPGVWMKDKANLGKTEKAGLAYDAALMLDKSSPSPGRILTMLCNHLRDCPISRCGGVDQNSVASGLLRIAWNVARSSMVAGRKSSRLVSITSMRAD